MFLFLFSLFIRASRAAKTKSKLSYIECFNFVKNVEDGIHNDMSIDQLKKQSKEFCKHVANKVKQGFCTSLIADDQFDKIYDLIKNQNLAPESVCNQLGYSRGFGGGRVISEELCTQIIDLLKDDLLENSAKEDLSNKKGDKRRNNDRKFKNKVRLDPRKISSNKICKSFSENDKMVCQIVSRIASRTLYEDLMLNASSIRICQKLQDQRKIQLAKDET